MISTAQIYELLPKVMKAVGAIAKADKNTQQNYSFRGIDRVLNSVSPALQEHGVCLSTKVHDYHVEAIQAVDRDNKPRMVYRATLLMDVVFQAPDGSEIVNTLAGEGQDYGGDKATNKAMAAAMKYGLFFGLVIPVEGRELDDSDRDQPNHDATPIASTKPVLNQTQREALMDLEAAADIDSASLASMWKKLNPSIQRALQGEKDRLKAVAAKADHSALDHVGSKESAA